ncbi:MAG: VOC family protein [Pseudomonadota bacterium]
MKSPIRWFEIPVSDFERAVRFYETVFAIYLHRESCPDFRLAVFPNLDDGIGGALCDLKLYQPGPSGVAIYLDGGNDLSVPLARVEAAGGKIVVGKTHISPKLGYMAFFEDCEGNRIGLHSRN